MDFKNANELLTLCEEQSISISEVMRNREIITGECPAKEADQKMVRVLEIMKEAARSPVEKPIRSMGGLIGGEAQKLAQHSASGQGLCGELLEKAITYAMATLETNASMGLIVASPTAGSAGIVPGLLLAFQEVYHFSDKEIQQVLFNAGAVGYLAMRNATVAGAVGGCQAEVGVASAMAASAAVELMGGNHMPDHIRQAGEAKDAGAEALCGCYPQEDDCVRHRTGRHGKDIPCHGHGHPGL